MIKLKDLINEELVGEMPNGMVGIEVYKNPKSIKRMVSELRAISFPSGDLFVIDDSKNVLHTKFAEWLNKNKYKNVYVWGVDKFKKGYIHWQRKGGSNDFWLSESTALFDEEERKEIVPYLEKYVKKVKSKNPQYKFILKSIWDD